MTEKIFGIDLGTTYSCIAHIDEYGKPVAIRNSEGYIITPSVIYFEGPENRVIGKEAKNVAVTYPNEVVEMVKRHMGESDWSFEYNGDSYPAAELSSYILRKLVQDAGQALNCEIKDVVITCPAYFGVNERKATEQAGEIANLNVRSIINEPTAAAIAYGLHDQTDQAVLVYDLGGGTFDITMIEIKAGHITVIATGGDHRLGGRDWDERVVTYLADQMEGDPLSDPETRQDLWNKAEDAKKALTSRMKKNITVLNAGERVNFEFTREQFNELTADLLEQTISYTDLMLEEAAKKGYTHFDQLLLVGGSTRMPQVMERLRDKFNIEPQSFDPDEAVAKGAALYGYKLMLGDEIKFSLEKMGVESVEEATPTQLEKAHTEVADSYGLNLEVTKQFVETVIINVSSHSFGVVANNSSGEEVTFNLVKINETVPVEASQTFYTQSDNQIIAEIRVMENEISADETLLDYCNEVGKALLHLPPNLPAGSEVEITFKLDEQGQLYTVAREVTTNATVDVKIDTKRVISREEVQKAIEQSTHLTFE